MPNRFEKNDAVSETVVDNVWRPGNYKLPRWRHIPGTGNGKRLQLVDGSEDHAALFPSCLWTVFSDVIPDCLKLLEDALGPANHAASDLSNFEYWALNQATTSSCGTVSPAAIWRSDSSRSACRS